MLRIYGLDKPREVEEENRATSWEEALVAHIKKKKEQRQGVEVETEDRYNPNYEIVIPQMPEEERLKREGEKNVAQSLYLDYDE